MLCQNCNIAEVSKFKNSKFCSRKCAAIYRSKDLEYLKKLSQASKNCIRKPFTDIHKENISKSLLGRGFKHSDETKEKMSLVRKGKSYRGKGYTNPPLSDEHKRKISANNKGGYCKWYDYIKKSGECVKVQGSYELRFAKLLDTFDPDWIKPSIWQRNHQFKWIDSNNSIHWYTPDFWSPKINKYFEVKGYWSFKQKEKKLFIENLNDVYIIYEANLKELENAKDFYSTISSLKI